MIADAYLVSVRCVVVFVFYFQGEIRGTDCRPFVGLSISRHF